MAHLTGLTQPFCHGCADRHFAENQERVEVEKRLDGVLTGAMQALACAYVEEQHHASTMPLSSASRTPHTPATPP